MRNDKARKIGSGLVEALSPYCERIEIAGSVRRCKPEVKDLEIVAIPVVKSVDVCDLFGPTGKVMMDNLLENFLNTCMPAGWGFDMELKRNGRLYKRLTHYESGLICDLFIATQRSWGGAFAIRTGPADFSQALVTLARRRGWQVSGGYYLHQHAARIDEEGHAKPCQFGEDCALILATPEESMFFDALGLSVVEPAKRNARMVWAAYNKV